MAKSALITGITGQDGFYLAELLHSQGYDRIYGLVRTSSLNVEQRIGAPSAYIRVEFGDLTDSLSLREILSRTQPDEIYNLGAQSQVQWSFKTPESTFDITGAGCLRMMEAIRQASPQSRFYQASSSEMFGRPVEVPQTELTPFHPRSPYGVAKVAAYWATVNYREAYGLFASSGILYNHESPRRGEEYVTRKVTATAARIAPRSAEETPPRQPRRPARLGFRPRLRARHVADPATRPPGRLRHRHGPDPFGARPVRGGLFVAWASTSRTMLNTDPQFVRPPEATQLVGNPAKAQTLLGWHHETTFEQLVEHMVRHDYDRLKRGGQEE